MFLSSFAVLVAGTMKVGGFSHVFDKNYQDGRIQLFNLDPDFRERHTIWGVTLGGGLQWLCTFGVSQMQIQRFNSEYFIDLRQALIPGISACQLFRQLRKLSG